MKNLCLFIVPFKMDGVYGNMLLSMFLNENIKTTRTILCRPLSTMLFINTNNYNLVGMFKLYDFQLLSNILIVNTKGTYNISKENTNLTYLEIENDV